MLVLAVAPPLPSPGQLAVLAQLVERYVSLQQGLRALWRAVVARCDELVMDTQRQARHVLRHRVALFPWEARQRWHHPFQQLFGPGVNHHALRAPS